MPAMVTRPMHLRISEEIRAALQQHCQEHGIEISTLVRTALLREIGRLDLLATMPPEGRPPKPKPPHKTAKRRTRKTK